MIDFGIMHVEGFASIEDETFDWGLKGLNIIQAPNGTGKTKFINALVWNLFGKTLSGSVDMWEHLRPSSYVGTKVVQRFSVNGIDYKLTRYKNYSKYKNALVLEEDGEPSQITDKIELQKHLNDLIGYSYELFKASIIFGQKLKRIISETGPNKKKVFDEAFEVTYIPRAKKIAEGKLVTHRQELTKKELEEEKLNGKINGKESAIASEEQLISGFEDRIEEKLDVIRVKIKKKKKEHKKLVELWGDIYVKIGELNHELEIFGKDLIPDKEIIEWERDLAKKESKRDRADEDADAVEMIIKKLQNKIDNVPHTCSNCAKAYTKSERKEEKGRLLKEKGIQDKLHQKFIDSIGILKGQIKELNESISSAQSNSESYEWVVKELNTLEDAKKLILESQKEVDKLKKERDAIKEEELENNLEKLNLELTDLQSQSKAMEKELKQIRKDVDAYEWVIKTPLSNSGLKAFIFNQMLDTINDRLEFYSKYIGFQVAFFIDMKSANKNLETYVFKGDQPVPYDDLSGGQQQAVDIAAAFAIHDVVSDSKSCSLLVMDEIFESLDRDNIEIITDVVQDKAQNKCLYLVTHRSEFNPTNSNIINVVNENGITSLA